MPGRNTRAALRLSLVSEALVWTHPCTCCRRASSAPSATSCCRTCGALRCVAWSCWLVHVCGAVGCCGTLARRHDLLQPGAWADVGQRADAALPHQRPELLAPRRHRRLPGAGRVRQGAQRHTAPVIAGVTASPACVRQVARVMFSEAACIVPFEWDTDTYKALRTCRGAGGARRQQGGRIPGGMLRAVRGHPRCGRLMLDAC